jgi:quercetin dioxygenase-like cupin family protein
MTPGVGFPTVASTTTHVTQGGTMPSISRHTATQQITDGRVESFSADLEGGYTVNFGRFRPDMDLTPLLKGAPGDRCQCPHWGYVLQGRLTYRFADHEETVQAGDAFYLPPGHIPVSNEPDSAIVQFSPTHELRQVEAVIMKNLQATQPQQ